MKNNNDFDGWTENRLDERLNITWYTGQITGLKAAIDLLLKQASSEFVKKNDREASLYRDMADKINDLASEIKKQQELARKEYDDKYVD